MNSNARASVACGEVTENLVDDNQSGKESKEDEPGEIITDLDFFGAFSLVNVQLQWRDLSADLDKKESDSEDLWNPKELFVDAVELFSNGTVNDVLPTPSFIAIKNFFVPLAAISAEGCTEISNIELSTQNVQTITNLCLTGF